MRTVAKVAVPEATMHRWLPSRVVVYILVTVGVAMISFAGAGLPPVLRACPRNSTDLDQCIIEVVNELRPRLATGDFGENFTITSLEPIVIDKLAIKRGESFTANFSNFRISGATHEKTGFIVKKLKTDLERKQINATLVLPKLQVNSKYDLRMSILVLQIAGKGDLQVNLTDTRVSLKLTFYTETVDGEEYFRFRPITLRVKFGKARFYLQNLFNGDPTLEAIGNQAINENPDVLLDEVKGGIEENLATLFTKIASEVVKDALFEEVFPWS
ncbi:circadian clock-controlled protein daywake-like isoform X1 [Anopheles aquasalis]|uniref:circadian clock-controlled protein daywake-like isoform X1 n=1 Tax=Anopheles aquasalis TaxID=42839 RepID=UPI00215A8F2B|nr:circadian clock-controlled protein daywake-like isoform X1 [Anopheles aquasalis]